MYAIRSYYVLAITGGETDFEILREILGLEDMGMVSLVDPLVERYYVIEPRKQSSAELSYNFV